MARVTLHVMNRKGLAVLETIVARLGGAVVSRVVGAHDPGVEQDSFDEIKSMALALGIPHFDRQIAPPTSADETIVAAGWRWIIRGASRVIVLHDSLLPRYRGFAPVVSCLINGEPQIGVTALLATENYDEGDILAQAAMDVSYPIKVAAAIDLLAPLYGDIAASLVARIVGGEDLVGRAQDQAAATYSLWRDDHDYRIDWTGPASRVRRFIDAVGDPYRGASCSVDGRAVRIFEAVECPDLRIENRAPGKVIRMEEGLPVVVCGEGLLKLLRIVDQQTGRSLLPFTKIRTRFQ